MDYKKEFQNDLNYARKNVFNVLLVEGNSQKGFNYPYLIYIPNKPKSTLIMDCLNDYEPSMIPGEVENISAIEEVLELFKEDEVIKGNSLVVPKGKVEEDKEKTTNRIFDRLEHGIIALSNIIGINSNAPAIVPLIPGYGNEGLGNVRSQLDKNIIMELAPQIKAMIEDAKKIIEERSSIKIEDKIVALGHSKSSLFANNFSTYYPEMCEAAILGGASFGTLPIDEIILQITDDDKISDNEKFQILDGKVTKKVAQKDLDRIIKEYNDTKKENQKEITLNEDGTYSLPLNFPVGIADIEDYRDFSNFPGGKEGYRQLLMAMPKMIFIGEQEDTRPGHYAYFDGKTLEGMEINAGTDIGELGGKIGRRIKEIEAASMHNRVLEYIAASNSLFGRSTNERLESYMQLYSMLNMPVQSKIYEGVGHANFNYSELEKNVDSISSKSIYASNTVKKDISSYYEGADSNNIPKLDDTDRAMRISPVPQLIRRFLSSGKDTTVLRGLSDEKIMGALAKYIEAKGISKDANMDRLYDSITAEELDSMFKTLQKDTEELVTVEDMQRAYSETAIESRKIREDTLVGDIKQQQKDKKEIKGEKI